MVEKPWGLLVDSTEKLIEMARKHLPLSEKMWCSFSVVSAAEKSSICKGLRRLF
jgi:hypothetical protein